MFECLQGSRGIFILQKMPTVAKTHLYSYFLYFWNLLNLRKPSPFKHRVVNWKTIIVPRKKIVESKI